MCGSLCVYVYVFLFLWWLCVNVCSTGEKRSDSIIQLSNNGGPEQKRKKKEKKEG